MEQATLPPVRDFGELKAGDSVNLGPAGHFVITEKRTAKFVTAEGEIPLDVEPGSQLNYIDLQGEGGKFATLDYGTGEKAEALYLGNEVSLEELGIEAVSDAERRKKVKGGSLSCTQCGGPLELRAPDQTKRIACSYCGALLDVERDFQVLETVGEMPVKPLIPLGSKGRLKGVEWQLIGFMERSVPYEGVRYAWREYLLYEARGGFRWLTENKGHWSFIEPVHAGDVADREGSYARYKGQTFSHFQSGKARVDHVVGEFYWAVSRGDMAQTHDYVSPPLLLSMEGTLEPSTHAYVRAKMREEWGDLVPADGPISAKLEDLFRRLRPGAYEGMTTERIWSQGTYLEPEEIWSAFGVKGAPPRRSGVAPNQVWEHQAAARLPCTDLHSRSVVPSRSSTWFFCSSSERRRTRRSSRSAQASSPRRPRRWCSARSPDRLGRQPRDPGEGAGQQLVALPRRRPGQPGDGQRGRL